MRSVLHLWNDDRGNGTLTAEWLFLMAIMVVGLTGGLIGMRDAILNEMQETTDTITSINRGFRQSARSHSATATDGTSASDTTHATATSGASASASTISD